MPSLFPGMDPNLEERTHSEVYAWALDQSLPRIRFPQKEPDGDLMGAATGERPPGP